MFHYQTVDPMKFEAMVSGRAPYFLLQNQTQQEVMIGDFMVTREWQSNRHCIGRVTSVFQEEGEGTYTGAVTSCEIRELGKNIVFPVYTGESAAE